MEEPSLAVNATGDSGVTKGQVDCVKDEKKVVDGSDPVIKKEEVTNGAVSNGEVTNELSDEQKKEDVEVKKEVGEVKMEQETEEGDASENNVESSEKKNEEGAASKPAIPVDERPMEMERSGGPKRALRIKMRGLQLDKYVRDIKSLYKLIVELFVDHLQVRVPNVKSPIWGDKWLFLEMKTLPDKQKVLGILENYSWQDLTLTALSQDAPSVNKFDISPSCNASDEDPVVTQENVLSFFLKYRNLPYKYQLEMKTKRTQDAVSELLEHLRDSDTRISNYINQYPPIIEETVPSMLIDGYTIDNYFHIGKDKETGEIKIGMKIFSHGTSVIAPISDCVNIPRYMAQLAQTFISALPEMEQLRLYDEETEEGDLLGIGIQMNFIGQLLLTVHVVRELVPGETNLDKDKKEGNNKKGDRRGPKNFNKNKNMGNETEQKNQNAQADKESDSKDDGGAESKSTEDDTKETEDASKATEDESKVGDEESKSNADDGAETKTSAEKADTEKNVSESNKDNKEACDSKTSDQINNDNKVNEDKVEEAKASEEDKSMGESEKTTVEGSGEEKSDDKTAKENETEEESTTKVETMEVDTPPVQKKHRISDKDLKQILMDFYKKYGSDLGVESIYYRICYYHNKKEVGNKFNENVRVVGPGCLHEMLGGVSFMVNPERMWAPPNRSFEAILSVVERLGRIGPDTVVILVSTDQRYVPLYLSKKCKEVIALGCWNFQTSYNAKRIADSKGCRNTEYCNVTGKLPMSVWNRIQSKQRVVAIFWDNADTNVLNKLLNMGCCNFIDVVSSEKRFSKSLYRHIVHADLRIVPTVVVPVDSHPHTDRYALVVKFSSPNMSPQLMNKRKKKNQGYHHMGQPQQHFKRTRGGGSGGGGGPRHHASTSSLPPLVDIKSFGSRGRMRPLPPVTTTANVRGANPYRHSSASNYNQEEDWEQDEEQSQSDGRSSLPFRNFNDDDSDINDNTGGEFSGLPLPRPLLPSSASELLTPLHNPKHYSTHKSFSNPNPKSFPLNANEGHPGPSRQGCDGRRYMRSNNKRGQRGRPHWSEDKQWSANDRNQYRGRVTRPFGRVRHRGGRGAGSFRMQRKQQFLELYSGDGGQQEASTSRSSGEQNEDEETGGDSTRGICSLMEIVWGPHNTTMSMKERYRVLGRTYPPKQNY